MEKLARKKIQQLTPYQSARRIGGTGDIWLNANESPFDNEYVLDCRRLNRYAECQPKQLIDAYASYAQVKPEQVLTTRGADEGIELLIRAYCEPGQDSILYCPPTYGMYAISAETIGVEQKTVALKPDWQLDLASIEASLETVKLVFVCNPNNPTGSLVNKEDLVALLEMTKDRAIVVIDEAYIDFCMDMSSVELLAQYSNLAILRTMSKAFALAGLRCGYTLANQEVINVLLKVIAPYPVPIPVSDIAVSALGEAGLAKMQSQVLELNANRAYLKAGLDMLEGITVFDGWGNFLLIQFPDGDALFKSTWDTGIILRNSPLENCVRISVGSRDECEKVLGYIRNYYS
ncbi:histidinol-phosphate transaminase [Vibrio marisflavi]|uniref:Histidinol-phosphate aminotransferase n=1 Tax=Vibrio marisflavi CECT 7928 TaxID=634439 RepID=A0ABN8E4W0_9VIBR|nr:histidinol-phosphate transaminase [Vibrio marisflavi]CAH0540567.1 Histidinol-phosphate aminotransferase [Vibrio marisflavi CECT 7928]